MKFDYTSVYPPLPQLKFSKRPLVPLEVFCGSEMIRVLGLIDSGADYTLMNAEYATYLGINIAQALKIPLKGISGTSEALLVPEVDIEIGGVGTAKIPVAFIESANVDVLLGQQGFFDAFKVAFEKYNNSFEVKAR